MAAGRERLSVIWGAAVDRGAVPIDRKNEWIRTRRIGEPTASGLDPKPTMPGKPSIPCGVWLGQPSSQSDHQTACANIAQTLVSACSAAISATTSSSSASASVIGTHSPRAARASLSWGRRSIGGISVPRFGIRGSWDRLGGSASGFSLRGRSSVQGRPAPAQSCRRLLRDRIATDVPRCSAGSSGSGCRSRARRRDRSSP